MDAELDKADLALDRWMKLQAKADEAAIRHKNHTAATIKALSEDGGVTKAKETAHAEPKWLERELYCAESAINAQRAKMEYEQAIRRWETARSEFSAGRRVK